jgi:hypothetical protein
MRSSASNTSRLGAAVSAGSSQANVSPVSRTVRIHLSCGRRRPDARARSHSSHSTRSSARSTLPENRRRVRGHVLAVEKASGGRDAHRKSERRIAGSPGRRAFCKSEALAPSSLRRRPRVARRHQARYPGRPALAGAREAACGAAPERQGAIRHATPERPALAGARNGMAGYPGAKWSERRDLNPRPPDPQSGALPSCATLRPNAGA